MRNVLLFVCLLGAFPAVAFDKIALVDSYDEIMCCDVETKAGTELVISNALATGANYVFWRNQSGAVPRYPSQEEDRRKLRNPLDKRRLCWSATPGWARLDQGRDVTNLIAYAFDVLRQKGIGTGIHLMFEECHYMDFTLGAWNFDHPQYWTRKFGGTPFHGRCSFAYDEVYEHKMRLVDELIALKPDVICLDLWRCGGWNVAFEYVPKMMQEFRETYKAEIPEDAQDPRWMALCAKYTERYLRGVSARCRFGGVKFYVELAHLPPWGDAQKDTYQWEKYALNWKKLAAEGVFDAVVVAGVDVDEKDAFASLKKTYEYVYANRGKAKVFYACSAYDMVKGIPTFVRATGLSKGAVTRKLLEIAQECQGEGVVMEVVDWGNYAPEVCREIQRVK